MVVKAAKYSRENLEGGIITLICPTERMQLIQAEKYGSTYHCEDVAGERAFESGGHSLPLLINPEQPGDEPFWGEEDEKIERAGMGFGLGRGGGHCGEQWRTPWLSLC